MRRLLPYFLIFVLVTISILIFLLRADKRAFNTVTVPGKFTVALPSYLSKAYNLDTSALLQYESRKEQVFLLLYEEIDSAHTVKSFFERFSAGLIAGLDRGKLIAYYPEKINGANAVVGNVRGSRKETEVYYRIAVLETENGFYKLIAGTTGRNRTARARDLDEIIRSVKPVERK